MSTPHPSKGGPEILLFFGYIFSHNNNFIQRNPIKAPLQGGWGAAFPGGLGGRLQPIKPVLNYI